MRTGLSGSMPSLDAPRTGEGAPAGKPPWRRPRPFSRPRWYPVAGAAAVAALLAGVTMTLLTVSRSQQARPLAHDCGLVTCGASLPAAVLGTAAPSTAVHGTAPARQPQRRASPPALAPAVHRRVLPAALGTAPPATPGTAPPATPGAAPPDTPGPGPWWARHRHHHHHWHDG